MVRIRRQRTAYVPSATIGQRLRDADAARKQADEFLGFATAQKKRLGAVIAEADSLPLATAATVTAINVKAVVTQPIVEAL